MTGLLAALALAAIVLDHAHLVSPVALAWTRPHFRRHMLARPTKFVVVPALCLGAAAWVGLTSARQQPAFVAMVLVYWWWNLLHFATQNYGLMRLLRVRGWFAEGAAVATVFVLAILPWAIPGPWVLPLLLGLSWGHWVTDIALSVSRAGRKAFFLVATLSVGTCGFLFKSVSADPHLCTDLAACTLMYSAPLWLGLRLGLGFVHFLYSRWIWQSPARGLLAA